MSAIVPLSSFKCRISDLACPICKSLPSCAVVQKPTDWFGVLNCRSDKCKRNATYYVCRFCTQFVLPGGQAITRRKDLRSHSRLEHHSRTMLKVAPLLDGIQTHVTHANIPTLSEQFTIFQPDLPESRVSQM